MEPFKDNQDLIDELRAQRPEPSQKFSAELDERAAAGFPRRSSRAVPPLAGLFSRLRALPPRRLAFSGGAVALAAIAVATVVVAANEPETDSASIAQLSPHESSTPPRHLSSPPRGEALAGGVGGGYLRGKSTSGAGSGGDGTGAQDSAGVQYETAVPTVAGGGEIKRFSREMPSTANSAGSAASTESHLSFGANSPKGSNASYDASGPYASRAPHRDVERSAEVVLGAEPDEVAGDAAEVFDAVHAANGIVLSSSVTGGAEGDAGARFDLLIPAAKLGDALADFSGIATVVSRHEATDDITAPTVRASEHLRDSRAKIDGLLVQLAGADDDDERAEVEAELRTERRHAASLRSQAAKLGRRANLSRVSLRIVTDPAATSPDQGGDWGVSDALDDAGHILGIAAGVTIVGLAILTPLALIALLAWLANRARLRRARERALA
jgi:hypothetical protein